MELRKYTTPTYLYILIQYTGIFYSHNCDTVTSQMFFAKLANTQL